MKVILRNSDDWQELVIDGYVAEEGHRLSARKVLEALESHGVIDELDIFNVGETEEDDDDE